MNVSVAATSSYRASGVKVKRWHSNLLVVLAACATIASASTTARAAESFEEKFRVVDRAGLPVSGVLLRACAIKWPSTA